MKTRRDATATCHDRAGMVLVLVLIVIALLGLAAFSFSEMMLAEHQAAVLHGRGIQAHLLADSGIDTARLFLAQDFATQLEGGGVFNNPDRFRGIMVVGGDSPLDRGRFTIAAPDFSEEQSSGLRYGLIDESTKLNLNILTKVDETLPGSGRTLLMALPGMTEEIADAILDWLDEDDEPRELGAEIEVYSGLQPPYAPKNGQIETVEELLLVYGVTPQMVFGYDVNRNGMIDMHEQTGDMNVDDPAANLGWSAYLTLYSAEGNLKADGTPKIDVNGEDLQKLYDDIVALGQTEWATFIVAYRQAGPSTSTSSSGSSSGQSRGAGAQGSGGGSTGSGAQGSGAGSTSTGAGSVLSGGSTGGSQGSGGVQTGGSTSNTGQEEPAPPNTPPDLTVPAKAKISMLLDLIGAKVSIKLSGQTKAGTLNSPFKNDPISMAIYLPILMESFAANAATKIPGRININQAPRTIIMGIPGMTEEICDKIMSERTLDYAADKPGRQYETWLVAEGLVDLNQMKNFTPYICGRGSVYRAHVVGYFEQEGPSARIEAVIDSSSGNPQLLFWRDISHLGRGFTAETLGVGAAE